jgi:TetR/AcrR family hemagglutinin/protease transcriptional regulator
VSYGDKFINDGFIGDNIIAMAQSRSSTQARAPRRAPKMPVEERRAQLLRCALRAFSSEGIGSAGHADIAAEAHVSVPTVFDYFPTRTALIEAVVDEVERFFSARSSSAISRLHTARGQLAAVLQDFADSCDTHPEYARVWVNWGTSFQKKIWPYYQRFMTGSMKFHRELIEAGLRRGETLQHVDPDRLTYLVIGTSTTIVQMKMQNVDPRWIAQYLDAVVAMALDQK